MTRIPQDELTTLKSAADVNAVAQDAVADLERMSVAHLINSAANCGEYRAVYSKPISDTLRKELIQEHYVLSEPRPIAKPGDETIISWEDVT